MISRALFCVFASLSFSLPAALGAADIGLAGVVQGITGANNDEVDQWRSSSILKSMDLDGDNVYGSAGYVFFATDALGNANAGAVVTVDPLTYVNGSRATLSSLPSYLSLANNGQNQIASSYGYKPMDDPRLTGPVAGDVESGGALRGGLALGTESPLFNLTVGTGFPSQLRLGIIIGNTDLLDGTLRLTQVTGGSATATFHETVPTGGADLGIAFFDITNAVPGEVFTFYMTKTNPQPTGGNINTNVIYGGLTFDAAVPEPSSALLATLGGMLALLRRRHTRS